MSDKKKPLELPEMPDGIPPSWARQSGRLPPELEKMEKDAIRAIKDAEKEREDMWRILSSPAPAPAPPPAPIIEPCGYWKGKEGSILAIRKASAQGRAIKVEGEAREQRAEGTGLIDGKKVAIHLKLLAVGEELDLDLRAIGDADNEGDVLTGHALGPDGIARNVRLHRLAPDAEGTWWEVGQTRLSFSRGRLEWHSGKQQVRASVTGRIFGRSGKGEVELGQGSFGANRAAGRCVHGYLDATDWSDWERYENDRNGEWRSRLQAGDYFAGQRIKNSYKRECQREGWWANDKIQLDLEMSADGTFLAGAVIAVQDQKEIITRVHLRRVRPDAPPEQSFL
jgi:hypothetical protein